MGTTGAMDYVTWVRRTAERLVAPKATHFGVDPVRVVTGTCDVFAFVDGDGQMYRPNHLVRVAAEDGSLGVIHHGGNCTPADVAACESILNAIAEARHEAR